MTSVKLINHSSSTADWNYYETDGPRNFILTICMNDISKAKRL